jgi:hypothetical protein
MFTNVVAIFGGLSFLGYAFATACSYSKFLSLLVLSSSFVVFFAFAFVVIVVVFVVAVVAVAPQK